MGSQLFCQRIFGKINLWVPRHLYHCLHFKPTLLVWSACSSSLKHSVHKLAHCRIALEYSPKYAVNKSILNSISTATAQGSNFCSKISSLKEMEAETMLSQNESGLVEAETLISQNESGLVEAEIVINQNNPGLGEAEIVINQNNPELGEAEALVSHDDTGVVGGLIANTEEENFIKNPEQSKGETENDVKPLSKKAMKRLARTEKHKEYKKRKREESLQTIQRADVGYSLEDLDKSSYYFENGIRKVYPYTYVFATHAKGRWVGRKLWDVLEQEFGYSHPDELMKSFESGMIHVNGNRASLNYVLRDNDYVCHRTHRHENPVTAAPLEIIENNNDVLVINKPSSIPCHPCGRYRFNSVAFILGKEMGLTNLRGIYRLDRLTSGVLIFCKTQEMTKTLMGQVARRQVQKEYVCRVVGRFPDGTVKVDQPLKPLSNKLRLQVVSPTGKSSQTTFTRISYNGKSSVVRCVPHTGRTHQIRVHLQYLGFPILNDAFYNSDAWGPSRGKDGVYELPFDQVCERILSEHHETLWVGGDNPLYEAKLREMELKEQKNSLIVNPNQHTANSLPAEPSNLSNTNCVVVGSSVTSDDLPMVSEKKRIFKTSGADILSHDGVNASDCLSQSVDGATNSHPSQTALFQKKDSQISDQSVHENQRLPGFEMSKLSIDLACDQCKKSLIDPQEKQLVMFLHALRYQGPGWEYETTLPDWALEDWSREEDFLLGSPVSSHHD
ncbi:unnamed protein product [Candidula unifasciata]|uniref:Pseudouridine synthase RsuA/RluA-like domain-containing protein n=1 Tax=Candidula unifasciata TaxID=100452 RepID=A0A8S3Z1D4_9EUPU|nr:unnamed protein product [Candidula unifasciata]